MGGWDDFTDDWQYYRPAQPLPVEGGLKTRSERGAIGSTWWSKRWITVLESLSMGTRLTRGRAYARKGQVLSIEIESGLVKARVQGSQPKPYTITIRLQPLTANNWEKVIEAMAAQAIFAAKLLAAEMPTNIEEAFASVQLSLFPTRVKDLVTNCTCPDWANPCKHTAAVYYLLAEYFDEDPFLIFKLRGRTKGEIIQALRQKRLETLPAESAAPSVVKQSAEHASKAAHLENLDTFWLAGEGLETFAINPSAPRVDRAVLKRLGDAPFELNGTNLSTLLTRAYDEIDAVLADEKAP